MIWNFTMDKKDSINQEKIINLNENKYPLKAKYINYFHLVQKSIFLEHNNFTCTYIIQHFESSSLYFALKSSSTGEGYLLNTNDNSYIKAHSQTIPKLLVYSNKYLISCSYDKFIKIWEISPTDNKINIKCISQLKGHKGRIYDMDLNNDKKLLISCGMYKTFLIWDLQKFSLIKEIKVTYIYNLMIKYLPPNNISDNNSKELVVVYSNNSYLNIVDINTNKIIDNFNLCKTDGSILFLNNKECIYQDSKNFNLIIFNFIEKRKVDELIGGDNPIILMHKADKGDKIISFYRENTIRVWNYSKKICELNIKIDFFLYSLYTDSKGKLYCGSLNKTFLFD